MLNKDGVRELAYVVQIDGIEPIAGSDNCEAAVVGGWRIMVRKGTFKVGDLAIYFEIDSQVPATEQFAFLEKKHYKIKTQKYTFGGKGNFVSQGLLMSAADFGWKYSNGYISKTGSVGDVIYVEGDFLTKELGVTYADPEDNKRKSNSTGDKYKKMAQCRPDIFTKPWARWMMRREWGRKVMFFFYGKKKDNCAWPQWVVKTDEERVQNMPWILEDKSEWFATEKIDGTSTTFTMRGWRRKREFYICSRNVCFNTPEKMEKGAFYDTNVYQEMAEKYDMEHVLDCLMTYFNNTDGNVDFVTVQGETYGAGIQNRDYGMTDHDFMVFNVIVGYLDGTRKRLNPKEMHEIMAADVPCVPIVDEHFVMPDTVDELLAIATDKSMIDGGMREGLVFRSYDGVRSFKAVSNEFLLKYHR